MAKLTRQMELLDYLKNHPEASIKEIQARLNVSFGHLSVILAQAKKAGLVENVKRGMYRLTASGSKEAITTPEPVTPDHLANQKISEKKDMPKQTQNKQQRPSARYRITIQGQSFAHDEIVDERTAREVVNLLINRKRSD